MAAIRAPVANILDASVRLVASARIPQSQKVLCANSCRGPERQIWYAVVSLQHVWTKTATLRDPAVGSVSTEVNLVGTSVWPAPGVLASHHYRRTELSKYEVPKLTPPEFLAQIMNIRPLSAFAEKPSEVRHRERAQCVHLLRRNPRMCRPVPQRSRILILGLRMWPHSRDAEQPSQNQNHPSHGAHLIALVLAGNSLHTRCFTRFRIGKWVKSCSDTI